jgi:hypothetical protein
MKLFIVYFSFLSYLGCILSNTPYQRIEICNEHGSEVSLYLQVEYHGKFAWNYENTIDANYCDKKIDVIPGLRYAFSPLHDENSVDNSVAFEETIIKAIQFQKDQLKYVIESGPPINAGKLPDPKVSEKIGTPDAAVLESVETRNSDISSTLKKGDDTELSASDLPNFQNSTSLRYLQSYHPSIFSRELTFSESEEMNRVRVIIISLSSTIIHLCRKLPSSGSYEMVNTLQPYEEFLLISRFYEEFAAMEFLSSASDFQNPTVLMSFSILPSQRLYIISNDEIMKTVDQKRLKQLINRQKYMKSYYESHLNESLHYLAYFDGKKNKPREKPKLHMWKADYIGQKHKVKSKEGFWYVILLLLLLCLL